MAWARQRGAAVHLDGARLWECKPHYGRSYAKIAADTPMMHLYLPSSDEALRAAALRLAEDEHIWTWPRTFAADLPEWRVAELAVGDATLDFTAGRSARW